MGRRKYQEEFMKKLTVLFLILAVASSAFALGRGQQSGGSATPPGGFTDYSRGFPQRVTIEIPVYERALQGWNVTDN
jgi:uncharacterized protein YdeI (BOF family)